MTTATLDPATEAQPRRSFTEPDRRQAMTLFASVDGREDQLLPLLAQCELGHVSMDNVRGWVYRDRKDEYLQIKAEVAKHQQGKSRDEVRALAGRATEVAEETTRQFQAGLLEGRVSLRDMPKAAQAFATTAAIMHDKATGPLGENGSATISLDLGDLAPEAQALGIHIVIGAAPQPTAPKDQPLPERPALPAAAAPGEA